MLPHQEAMAELGLQRKDLSKSLQTQVSRIEKRSSELPEQPEPEVLKKLKVDSALVADRIQDFWEEKQDTTKTQNTMTKEEQEAADAAAKAKADQEAADAAAAKAKADQDASDAAAKAKADQDAADAAAKAKADQEAADAAAAKAKADEDNDDDDDIVDSLT